MQYVNREKLIILQRLILDYPTFDHHDPKHCIGGICKQNCGFTTNDNDFNVLHFTLMKFLEICREDASKIVSMSFTHQTDAHAAVSNLMMFFTDHKCTTSKYENVKYVDELFIVQFHSSNNYEVLTKDQIIEHVSPGEICLIQELGRIIPISTFFSAER